MSTWDTVSNTATFRFIMRNTASGRFSEYFQRENFEINFPKYHSQGAIVGNNREALSLIMNCDTCLTGLGHIHQHLHDRNVVAKECELDNAQITPRAFYFTFAAGILLFAASVTSAPWAWQSDSFTLRIANIVGTLSALWLLFRSRYDKV